MYFICTPEMHLIIKRSIFYTLCSSCIKAHEQSHIGAFSTLLEVKQCNLIGMLAFENDTRWVSMQSLVCIREEKRKQYHLDIKGICMECAIPLKYRTYDIYRKLIGFVFTFDAFSIFSLTIIEIWRILFFALLLHLCTFALTLIDTNFNSFHNNPTPTPFVFMSSSGST